MGGISSVVSSLALSASTVNELTVDVGFSTTIHGKTYDAGVTYASGAYVASDRSLSGAEATGTSLQNAESNLGTRIDMLV